MWGSKPSGTGGQAEVAFRGLREGVLESQSGSVLPEDQCTQEGVPRCVHAHGHITNRWILLEEL